MLQRMGTVMFLLPSVILAVEADRYAAGTIVNAPSDHGLYVLQGGKKRPVPSQAIFDALLSGRDFLTISDADFQAIPLGTSYLDFPDGTILQDSTTGGRYAMDGYQRRAIPNQYTFDVLLDTPGTLRHNIKVLPPTDLARIPEGPALPRLEAGQKPSATQYPAGTIVNAPSDQGLYVLRGGKKRPVPSQAIFDALLSGRDFLTISDADFQAIPLGTSYLDFPDGTILQDSTTGGRYAMDGYQRRAIPNQYIFNVVFSRPGTLRDRIKILSPGDLARVPEGPSMASDIPLEFPVPFHSVDVYVNDDGSPMGSAHMETSLTLQADGSLSGSYIYKNDSVTGWCGGILIGIFDVNGRALAGFTPPSGCINGKGPDTDFHERTRTVNWGDKLGPVTPRAREIRLRLYGTEGQDKFAALQQKLTDTVNSLAKIAQEFGTIAAAIQ